LAGSCDVQQFAAHFNWPACFKQQSFTSVQSRPQVAKKKSAWPVLGTYNKQFAAQSNFYVTASTCNIATTLLQKNIFD
jgi:hypothetical protein